MAHGACCKSGDKDSTQRDQQKQSVMTASQHSPSRDSLLFSLQFTCADDGLEKLNDANASDQCDPVLELQKIQRVLGGLSEAEQQLASAVQEAKASSILSTGSVDLWAVGSYLRSKHGYLVALRRANVSKRPKAYLRQLRHDFLVVRGLPTIEGVDILVDLNFRDHFRVAHATPWYSKLLAALPQDWIGSAQALAPLVGLMSAGIRLCFRQAGIPLPPWREGRAMLSKWVTELHCDEPVPVVPLPDKALRRLLAPYHTPFRTAVQQARNPSAGAGAGAGGFSKHQQQQGGHIGAGQGSNTAAALPPLPPSSAAAQKPAQQHAHDAAEHSAHYQVVPDVPRKIIVGFPVASPPSPALQQQLGFATDQDMTVIVVPTAAAVRSIAKYAQQQQAQVRDAAVSVPTQQQGRRQRSGRGTSATTEEQGSSELAQQRGAAADGRAIAETAGAKSVQALAQVDPHTRTQSTANSQNAAVAPVVSANSKAPAAPAAARPAFASTTGVVVATAGGTSPGIVVNKQWVQQLTEGVISGSSADKGKALAAGAVAAVAAAVGSVDGSGSGSNGGSDASQGTAGAPTAAAVRQFTSLDQLLPRMRTVKLGAG